MVTCFYHTLQQHFIQQPFPNQIEFGLEKLRPTNPWNFPNLFQIGLKRKKNDFEGLRFQTKFRLVWKILMTIVNVLKSVFECFPFLK